MKETVEMYEALGFEVKVENFNPEEHPLECNECMRETPEKFKVIYTKPGEAPDEGLFDE